MKNMKDSEINNKKIDILDITAKVGVLAGVVFLLTVFIYGQFFVETENLYANQCDAYESVWNYTDLSGATHEYRGGETFDTEYGKDIVLSMTLPEEIGDGNAFFIRSKTGFDAYIDGELRNSYNISDSFFGPNVKYIWLSITLRRSDVGKELTLVHSDYKDNKYTVSDMYFGNRLGFSAQLIHDNIYIIILGFALFILGLVVTLISLAYRIILKKDFHLWYLGLGVLSGALWLITSNYTYPLMFGNYFVDGVVSFMLLLLLPFDFIAYVNALSGRRYRVYYIIISFIIFVNFCVLTVLDYTYTADYNKTMPITSCVMGISGLFCLIVLIYDTFKKKHFENKSITIGFSVFVVLIFAEAIHMNIPKHNNNGVFIAIGLLGILSVAVLREIRAISILQAEMLEAREANRAKSTFLANMSHEIRTPMNAVIGMAELALREEVSPKAKDYLTKIRSSGRNLLGIINDILDYSKIESGKMGFISERYEPVKELKDIAGIIQTRIGDKPVSFEINPDPSVPHVLSGDALRIRQVIINLANNAVKFTKEGYVKINVSAKELTDDTVMMTYHVVDTGVGIKQEDMEKLFVSFQQIDSKRNRAAEGTGLGLAISKNLVEAMGGRIGVTSTYGQGSDFYFSIPQKVVDSESDSEVLINSDSESDKFINDRYTAPDVKVLIVDDYEINITVAEGLLEPIQVKTESATSAKEAIKMVEENDYDIILMDHMMPEMDGIEATRYIRENIKKAENTPIIAFTANVIEDARSLFAEVGMSDFIPKPIEADKLLTTIRKWIPEDKIIAGTSDAEKQSQTISSEDISFKELDTQTALKAIVNPVLYRKTVKEFYKSGKSKLDEIRKAYANEDWQNYTIKVHTLKSSSRQIGAFELGDKAAELEEAGNAGNIDKIRLSTDETLKDYENLLDALAVYFEDDSPAETVLLPMDETVITGILNELEKGCDNLDMDSMESSGNELKKYRYSDDIQKKIERLYVAIEGVDTEACLKLIDELKNCFTNEH
ncbi:MAG: response regulator [Lachnospiraceae bacterium]|nr:response regulator [Lachnospiraceae bacterium]